jgi:ribosomal protein S11
MVIPSDPIIINVRFDTAAQTDVKEREKKKMNRKILQTHGQTHTRAAIIWSVMKKNKIKYDSTFFSFSKRNSSPFAAQDSRALLVRAAVKGLKQFHFHMSGPDGGG